MTAVGSRNGSSRIIVRARFGGTRGSPLKEARREAIASSLTISAALAVCGVSFLLDVRLSIDPVVAKALGAALVAMGMGMVVWSALHLKGSFLVQFSPGRTGSKRALSLCAPSSLPGIHGGHGRHPRRHPELYGALGKRCVLSSCHGVQGTIGRCGLGKKVRQRVARLCCAHGVPVAAMALEAIASSFCEKQGAVFI